MAIPQYWLWGQWGLLAASHRLPFLPTRSGLGSDVLENLSPVAMAVLFVVLVGMLNYSAHTFAADERAVAVRQLAQAEPDTELGRGLIVVAALLGARAGKSAESLALLREEHERDPSDVVLALFTADLLRREGDPDAAARAVRPSVRAASPSVRADSSPVAIG